MLINGTRFEDFIYGTDNSDIINGRAGNDTLLTLAGNDTVLGGRGDDHIIGGSGSSTLYGNLDNDYIYSGTGTNNLVGGPGNDTLVAERSATSNLFGGIGDDLLVFSYGRGTGGPGNDTFELGDWYNFGRTFYEGGTGTARGDLGKDHFNVNFSVNGLSSISIIEDFNPAEDVLTFAQHDPALGFPVADNFTIYQGFDKNLDGVLNVLDWPVTAVGSDLVLQYYEDVLILRNTTDLVY